MIQQANKTSEEYSVEIYEVVPSHQVERITPSFEANLVRI